MTSLKEQVAAFIRIREPNIDIRTDQCDIVRVNCGMTVIGIVKTESGFRADEISLDGENDFDTTLVSSVEADSVEEIGSKVVDLIRRLRK